MFACYFLLFLYVADCIFGPVKKLGVLLLFTLLGATFSFGANSETADSLEVVQYFESKGLVIDSCTNHNLYLEVYKWLGTPYRFGGESANGLDCSGFSNKIYEATFNKTLLGGSRDIFKTVIPVDIEHAVEGDLLFFKISRGQISHVGVYLGNGKFAHATTRAGVIISDLSEPYYQRSFYKAGKLQF